MVFIISIIIIMSNFHSMFLWSYAMQSGHNHLAQTLFIANNSLSYWNPSMSSLINGLDRVHLTYPFQNNRLRQAGADCPHHGHQTWQTNPAGIGGHGLMKQTVSQYRGHQTIQLQRHGCTKKFCQLKSIRIIIGLVVQGTNCPYAVKASDTLYSWSTPHTSPWKTLLEAFSKSREEPRTQSISLEAQARTATVLTETAAQHPGPWGTLS